MNGIQPSQSISFSDELYRSYVPVIPKMASSSKFEVNRSCDKIVLEKLQSQQSGLQRRIKQLKIPSKSGVQKQPRTKSIQPKRDSQKSIEITTSTPKTTAPKSSPCYNKEYEVNGKLYMTLIDNSGFIRKMIIPRKRDLKQEEETKKIKPVEKPESIVFEEQPSYSKDKIILDRHPKAVEEALERFRSSQKGYVLLPEHVEVSDYCDMPESKMKIKPLETIHAIQTSQPRTSFTQLVDKMNPPKIPPGFQLPLFTCKPRRKPDTQKRSPTPEPLLKKSDKKLVLPEESVHDFYKNGRLYTQYVDEKGKVRVMLIPQQKEFPAVLNQDEIDRIKELENMAEALKKREELIKIKNQKIEESNERVKEMRAYASGDQGGLTALEKEDLLKKTYIRERGYRMALENDEAIKTINKIIAEAAQKAIIKQQVVDRERLRALQGQENKQEAPIDTFRHYAEDAQKKYIKEQEEKQSLFTSLKDAIRSNKQQEERQRALELEAGRKAQEALFDYYEKELQFQKKKDAENAILRKQFRTAMELAEHAKEKEKEEEMLQLCQNQAISDERDRQEAARKQNLLDKIERRAEIAAALGNELIKIQETEAIKQKILYEMAASEVQKKYREQDLADEKRKAHLREEFQREAQRLKSSKLEEAKELCERELVEMIKCCHLEDNMERAKANKAEITAKFKAGLIQQVREKEKERLREAQEREEEIMADRQKEKEMKDKIEEAIHCKIDVLMRKRGIPEHFIGHAYTKMGIQPKE